MGEAGSPPCRSLRDLSKCQICVASPFPKGARAHQAVVQPFSNVGGARLGHRVYVRQGLRRSEKAIMSVHEGKTC